MTVAIPVTVTAELKKIDLIVNFHWRGKKIKTFGPTPRANKMLNAFDSWKVKNKEKTNKIAKIFYK